MTIKELCVLIELQEEITVQVMEIQEYLIKNGFYETQAEQIEMIRHRETWDEGLLLVKEQLRALMPDENNLEMIAGCDILTVMMSCLCETYEVYRRMGIPDRIFVDTMKCFRRFIGEHRVSYGVYGFDRDFWTPRQISMLLFRIGELEYEMADENGKQWISIHIPSDAVLTQKQCRESYEQAKRFFDTYFPVWGEKTFACTSWLLAPGLKQVLPPSSNIICFQDGFDITDVDEDSKEFMEWVYKRRELSYEELPEHTSLQRNMKRFLLDGGKIGEAGGILKPDAWMEK